MNVYKIFILRGDIQETIICNILYVPSLESKLRSLGQLLERNYTLRLEDKELNVFDAISKVILKARASVKQ